MTMIVAGTDIAAKAEMAEAQLWDLLGGRDQFDTVEVQLLRTDHEDPPSHEASFAYLKVTVVDGDAEKVGRRFSNAVVELVLSSYPGFTLTSPPGPATPVLQYWPGLIEQPASHVAVGGEEFDVPPAPGRSTKQLRKSQDLPVADANRGATVAAAFGRVVGARSGDKGGDANLGVWARRDEVYDWLVGFLTTERLRLLLPETAGLEVERYLLPNLKAVNFLLRGYLGDGVSSSNKLDPQAKALGEYLRAKVVEIPEKLLAV
jgi:hypothetical protein